MSRHVLVIGGHGKIAQLLTSILLKKSWTVTSMIRSRDQVPAIEELGKDQPGKLNILVSSLEDVQDESQARAILADVKPNHIAWSAGAGGRGGPDRTQRIDRDACIYFIKAAASIPSITRFLLVSYLASRRAKPSWWDNAAWDAAQEVNQNVLKTYYEAKIASDEVLYRQSRARPGFVGINLRPGTLTSEPAGSVEMGKVSTSRGKTSRATVAEVAALLLEKKGIKNCWLDVLDGKEDLKTAVDRCVEQGVDCAAEDPVFSEK